MKCLSVHQPWASLIVGLPPGARCHRDVLVKLVKEVCGE